MKSEIKHAEVLPITIIRVFNSDKQPFAWFETKILNIFAGGDREISIIDRNSCHERQEKATEVCVWEGTGQVLQQQDNVLLHSTPPLSL